MGTCTSTAGKPLSAIIGHAELGTEVDHHREGEINIYGCVEIHIRVRHSWFQFLVSKHLLTTNVLHSYKV